MKDQTEQWVVVVSSELASMVEGLNQAFGLALTEADLLGVDLAGRPDYVVGPFDDANRAMSEGQAAADLSIGERKVFILRTSPSLGMLADKDDREEATAQ